MKGFYSLWFQASSLGLGTFPLQIRESNFVTNNFTFLFDILLNMVTKGMTKLF